MEKIRIAIDGPAGAGKSTIAKMVAKKLGAIYIDTGAMYRAVGYYFLRNRIAVADESVVNSHIDNIDINIEYLCGVQHVFLNGEDVSAVIRNDDVSAMASQVSVFCAVRTKLVELQKGIAARESVVMDGRDIGSVVLPNAEVKIYLTASVEERTRRRYADYVLAGQECDIEKIRKEIEERDYRDMHREISPLVRAEDAVIIDSSNMSIEEVANEILGLAEKVNNGSKGC